MLINKQIKDLSKPVPIPIRLEIYSKLLNLYNKKQNFHGLPYYDAGLCLALPCVLWNLNDYLDDAPSGVVWQFNETKTAFPEMRNAIDYIMTNSLTVDEIISHRITVLHSAIKTLTIDLT